MKICGGSLRVLKVPALISVLGAIILVAGFCLAITAPLKGTWEEKGQAVHKTIYVGQWEKFIHFRTRIVIPPFYLTKDFVIRGSAHEQKLDIEGVEIGIEKFNFYAFNKTNFDSWKANLPCESFFEAREVNETSFSFSPAWKEGANSFYFVVEYPSGPRNSREVKIHAAFEWKESRYEASIVGATVLSVVGTLIVVGGVAATLKKQLSSRKTDFESAGILFRSKRRE